jgi:hypothetical protein
MDGVTGSKVMIKSRNTSSNSGTREASSPNKSEKRIDSSTNSKSKDANPADGDDAEDDVSLRESSLK